MIVRVNGRIVYPESTPVMAVPVPVTPDWRESILHWMDRVEAVIKKLLPPPGAMLAAAPVGGLAGNLWPLVSKLQEFALVGAIAVSLWGLIRYIAGDPGGKGVIGQAIIGYIGIFVIPEVFFSIRAAFN